MESNLVTVKKRKTLDPLGLPQKKPNFRRKQKSKFILVNKLPGFLLLTKWSKIRMGSHRASYSFCKSVPKTEETQISQGSSPTFQNQFTAGVIKYCGKAKLRGQEFILLTVQAHCGQEVSIILKQIMCYIVTVPT